MAHNYCVSDICKYSAFISHILCLHLTSNFSVSLVHQLLSGMSMQATCDDIKPTVCAECRKYTTQPQQLV